MEKKFFVIVIGFADDPEYVHSVWPHLKYDSPEAAREDYRRARDMHPGVPVYLMESHSVGMTKQVIIDDQVHQI